MTINKFMTTRRFVWLALVTSGALYQLLKLAFGIPMTWGATLDSAYWGGAALLMHWWQSK